MLIHLLQYIQSAATEDSQGSQVLRRRVRETPDIQTAEVSEDESTCRFIRLRADSGEQGRGVISVH